MNWQGRIGSSLVRVQAIWTKFESSSSSIRFSTWTATSASVARRSSVRGRSRSSDRSAPSRSDLPMGQAVERPGGGRARPRTRARRDDDGRFGMTRGDAGHDHSPAPPGFGPVLSIHRAVLSTRKGAGSAPMPDRGPGTSNIPARRLRDEWPGTAKPSPSRSMTEPISPSFWRKAGQLFAVNVPCSGRVSCPSGPYIPSAASHRRWRGSRR